VLIASLSRALVLSDRQVHFYTLPALDPLSAQIKPIRHIEGLAVDELQLRKFAASGPSPRGVEQVDFCVVKRTSIALYSMRDKLHYRTEMPFPAGGILARRSGSYLCIADKEFYHMVDLNAASTFPMVPISQAGDGKFVRPSITVINENEFLLLSWTGQATIGIFITVDGDPVRGTLEWPTYPESITLDYPFITAILPNQTIDIHNIETQSLVQSIPAPPPSPTSSPRDRKQIVWSAGGYMVPATQGLRKLKITSVPLVRKNNHPVESEGEQAVAGALPTEESQIVAEETTGINDVAQKGAAGVPEETAHSSIPEQ